MKRSEDPTPVSPRRRAVQPRSDQACRILESIVRPKFEALLAEREASSLELEVLEEEAWIGGVLVHHHALAVNARAIDAEHTRLRFDLLAGMFAGDLVTPIMAIGHLLDDTPFYVQPDAGYRHLGQMKVCREIVVREDDEPLIHRALAEVQQLTQELTWYFPLRLPTRLALNCSSSFEIPWTELPHDNLDGFLDWGLDSPPADRAPVTLMFLAMCLGRWEEVLRLIHEHPGDLGVTAWVPLEVMALRQLERWEQAVEAAEAADIREGRYPWGLTLSPSYMQALIESGRDIEALQILGQPVRGEPALNDWLRGFAFHRAGDRQRASRAFRRYFNRWPGDVLGNAAARTLSEEAS